MVVLASCADGNDETRHQWRDFYSAAECHELMSVEAIKNRCGSGDMQRTMQRFTDDPTSCIPYSPSRKMAGLWVEGFESSAFFEGARSWADISPQVDDQNSELTWLSVNSNANLPQRESADFGSDWSLRTTTRVEFVGKRSLCSWGYGHLGGSEHEVIVERFISYRPVPMTQELPLPDGPD